jgi:hypothetical protein
MKRNVLVLFFLFLSIFTNAQENGDFNLEFLTKLDLWGGDGKWHEMYRNDDGFYWVNHGDPFKIMLSGNPIGITVKVSSSNGAIFFDRTYSSDLPSGHLVISDKGMIGVSETLYYLVIMKNGKVLRNAVIESVPGGE